jgi:hypothetical protein
MADECIEFRKIENRCREVREWIYHKAPQCLTEQRHLEESSQERAYWAHGYLMALLDVLGLFSRSTLSGQAGDDGEASSQRYAA